MREPGSAQGVRRTDLPHDLIVLQDAPRNIDAVIIPVGPGHVSVDVRIDTRHPGGGLVDGDEGKHGEDGDEAEEECADEVEQRSCPRWSFGIPGELWWRGRAGLRVVVVVQVSFAFTSLSAKSLA